jgi:hypothetical protein
VFLDAPGARRTPDPTTAGDFGRRFTPADIDTLQDVFHDVRQGAWRQQTDSHFFDLAVIDRGGSLVATGGQGKQGMDIAYDGTGGYHAFVRSLAHTGEVLWLLNRSGNRPAHEGAAAVDRVVAVCRQGGSRQVLLRGDTDFSQSEHLDRGGADDRPFRFGFDAVPPRKAIAEDLPAAVWQPLPRLPHCTAQAQPRARPDKVQGALVVERAFENQRLCPEEVSEYPYQPTACGQPYRRVVVRQNLSVAMGDKVLFDDVRYFSYLTNVPLLEPEQLVWLANNRCHQENLLAPLHGGVRAWKAPVSTLQSHGGSRVRTALAWDLKAWWALQLPAAPGRWPERHRQEKRRLLGPELKKSGAPYKRLETC